MKTILLISILFSMQAKADDVFRITVGNDFKTYTNADLQRRVWELERAVNQLQMRVYQLEGSNTSAVQAANATWSCTVNAQGIPFTGTGNTKPAASAAAIDNCTKHAKDAFFCNYPKCDQ